MSALSTYLKMDNGELAEEITKQKRKIAAAQETIALLKRLQIASDAITRTRQSETQHSASTQDSRTDNREVYETP